MAYENIMGVVDWLRGGGRQGAVDGATLGGTSIAPIGGEVNPNLVGTAPPIRYIEQKYGSQPRLRAAASGYPSAHGGKMPEAFDSQDGDGGHDFDLGPAFANRENMALTRQDDILGGRGFSDPGPPLNNPGMQFFQRVGGGRQMIPRVGSTQSRQVMSLQDLYNALQDNVQPRQFENLIRRYFNENPWVAEQMFGGNLPEQIDVYAWKKYLESNFGPYAELTLDQQPTYKLPMPGSVNDINNAGDTWMRRQGFDGTPNIWGTALDVTGDQMAPSARTNPQDFFQSPTTLEPGGVVPDAGMTPTPGVLPGVDNQENVMPETPEYSGPLTGDFLKRYQAGPSSVAKFMPWLTDANRHNNLLAAQGVLDKDWLTSGDVGNINPNELKGAIGMGTAQGPSISQLFGSAGGGLDAGSWLERIKKLPWGNADPAGSSMRNIGR